MDIRILKSQLSQPYQRNQWTELLPTIFGQQVQIDNRAEKITISGTKAKSIERFASISLMDNKNIAVLDIETNENIQIERNRVALRDMAYQLIDQDRYHGLLIFYYNNEGKKNDTYRLSFVSKETSFDGSGNMIEKSTHPKRYTYVLGAGETRTTTAQRLLELKAKQSAPKSKGVALKDVTDAFSVSNLTKEFYKEIYDWYQWVLSEEVGITFPKNTNTSEDDREKLEEQIIRLITRLLFVWFIKQKQLVPDSLFDTKELEKVLCNFDPQSHSEGNYYNAILQNLFFATLNKAIDERAFAKTKTIRDIKTLYRYADMFSISENEVMNIFRPIPFLNGGLFECLDKEDAEGNKYFLDGFSRNPNRSANGNFRHRAFIPNSVFFHEEKGIIPLLQRYNFTVEEYAPEDVQVALDPELLGNVFENLLGVFNSETKETARKQSGSFYTPREIVDYMVSESLIAYLQNACPNVEVNDIRYLLEKAELPNNFQGDEKQCVDISTKLKAVKIIDPACGSGAFPMGILKKMVAVLDKLDIKDKETAYEQKLHLIEECIYGVDIQTIAAQISKLRFFISLIVEQDKDETKPNYGITPLPNLETKFVAANTLIAKKKKPAQLTIFENGAIDEVKEKLLEIRRAHFYAKSASEKKRLREKDDELRQQLSKLLEDSDQYAHGDAVELAHWNPYNQNETAAFFDVEWMFGLKSGFDVVIGNPPYLRIQGIRDANPKFADELIKNYKSASGSFDLYVVFTERSFQLIKPNGLINFIMPTKWTNAAFGKGLRAVMASNKAASKIIDFGAFQVFNASTYTGIQFFTPNSSELNYYELDKNLLTNEQLAEYLKSLSFENANVIPQSKLSKETWILTKGDVSTIIDKLNLQPRRISDVFEKIFQGLATSKDDVYFLYNCTDLGDEIRGYSKQLNKEIIIEKAFIKPLLKGEDVHRYEHIQTNRFVIFPYKIIDGKAELYIENEISTQFPQAYKYLKECEDLLRDREKGRFNIDGEWFQYGRKQGINFAEQEKLVAPEISFGGNFSYDKNGEFYSTTTIYGYIKKADVKDSYKTLLALMNSKLLWWYLVNTGTVLANGYFRFKPNYINPFPVPNIASEISIKLEKIVDKIFQKKRDNPGENIKGLQEQIDNIIFKLYDLNENDITQINYM